jgi:hypothetical protein
LPLDRAGVTGEAAVTLWRDIKSHVDGRAEVDASAIALPAPLGGHVHQTDYRDTPALSTLQQRIHPEYFEVMRIAVIAGRTFITTDERAVIVSRRLAIEMFGTLDVLGRGFPRSHPTDVIVGVVGDAHTIRVHATTVAELYRPLRREDYAEATLVARTRDDAARLVPVLRDAAQAEPRVVPVVRLLRDEFDRRTRGPRIAAVIASAVGLSTLWLACLGIFGVVSYAATLRAREIGIRTALGATRGRLLGTLLRRVLSPVAIGMVLGLAASTPLAATWPAARALRGNPADALRQS